MLEVTRVTRCCSLDLYMGQCDVSTSEKEKTQSNEMTYTHKITLKKKHFFYNRCIISYQNGTYMKLDGWNKRKLIN